MSELKAYTFSAMERTGLADYYLKSEADKVIAEKDEKIDELEERIDELQKATDSAWSKVNAMYDELRHHKYKRCLAMAQICYKNSVACANYTMPHEKYKHWRRWQTIWSEFAKRFKTNSTAQHGKEEAK